MTKNTILGAMVIATLAVFASCGDDSGSSPKDTGDASVTGGAAGFGGSGVTGGVPGSGGTAGTGTAGSGGSFSCPTERNSFVAAYTAMICAKNVECCSENADTCADAVEADIRALVPELSAAIASGTASIDCTAFEACQNSIQAASCDDWPLSAGSVSLLPVNDLNCARLLKGAQGAGESCSYHYECDDGYCDPANGAAGNGGADNGGCIKYVATDGTCGQGLPCNPVTHYCDQGNTDTCKLLGDIGDDCTKKGQCLSGECSGGGGAAGAGTCVKSPECKYRPKGLAKCSMQSGKSSSGYEILVLALLAGLRGARRRRV